MNCPKCKNNLIEEENILFCENCNEKFSKKFNIYSFIENDDYWGEFSEDEMDILLEKIRKNNFNDAYNYIDKKLNRKDFIFGKARSDFIYYLNLDKNSICLDTGCGLGVHSFNMASLAKQVYGFDLSLKRLQFCEARKKHYNIKNLSFIHSDFYNLPFKNNYFDCIIMNGVLEWVGVAKKFKDPRDDQIEVLKKNKELLKEGGRLYVGIENRFASVYWQGKGKDHSGLRFTSLMPRFLANIVTHLFCKESYRTYTYSIFGYKKIFNDAGFKKKNVDYYIAYPGYNSPQFIIPFDDIEALRFFILNMTKNKKLKGRILRVLAKSDIFIKFARHLFFSYLIFAKK